MSTPAITVLMPVYNAEVYLRQAIESILAQTFRDFEFLIINDGSSDRSEEIIISYTDPRIRYVKNETNLRLIATLNKGIALTNTKYIARMDADDVSIADRLQVQFDFMEQNEPVAICGSWFEIIGGDTRVVKYVGGHSAIMLKMLYQCHFCHPSVIIRKQVLDEGVLKFDSNFPHAEDYDLFTRIGEKYHLANIQKVLLKYRHHEASVSSVHSSVQYENSLKIKKRLFQKVGVSATEEEIELFRKISQHEYAVSAEFLKRSGNLLEKMLIANEKTNFFDPVFFRTALATFWFHISYNLSSLGSMTRTAYFQSPLAAYYPLTTQERVKFFFKPLLK